jgi:hypothetical protein
MGRGSALTKDKRVWENLADKLEKAKFQYHFFFFSRVLKNAFSM